MPDLARRAAQFGLDWMARESGYLRLRSSDGRRNGPGLRGSTEDPHGPLAHQPGNGDPGADTWLYTNPIFIDVR